MAFVCLGDVSGAVQRILYTGPNERSFEPPAVADLGFLERE